MHLNPKGQVPVLILGKRFAALAGDSADLGRPVVLTEV